MAGTSGSRRTERGLRGPLACPGEILPGYLEIVIGNGLTDIVAELFDASVAPSYFASRSQTLAPQDLTGRTCINLRRPMGVYAWEFEKRGRTEGAGPRGNSCSIGIALICKAALAGFGPAYLAEEQVQSDLNGAMPLSSTVRATPLDSAEVLDRLDRIRDLDGFQ